MEAAQPLHPHLTRQLDLIPIEVLGQRINVIGCGAIGSFTVLALAKMGFVNINVFDGDTIEVENMNCQFYRRKDIGSNKALALQNLVEDFTGYRIDANDRHYDPTLDGQLPGIVISAVDSMAVRKSIWLAHVGIAPATKLVIDPRMGAESALSYAMQPMSIKDGVSYDKSLYTDEAAVQERCTAKATMYTACMLAGHVSKIVKDFVTGAAYSRVTQWNIADNAFLAFPAPVEEAQA